MSTKNIELSHPKEKQNRLAGVGYDGKEVFRVSPSLFETYTSKYFNPVNGSPSSYHTLNLDLSVSDEFNLNSLMLEFTQSNRHATASQIILNPYLLFSEFKVLLNNVEVLHYDNQEAIFLAVSVFFRGKTDDERTAYLSTIFPTQSSNPLAGETVAAQSSVNWSLPLEPLTNFINNISRSDGLAKLTLEFRFVPNYGVQAMNGRFIRAGADVNVYTESNIAFNNIALRLHHTKHSDPLLRNVPNGGHMVLHKFDVKTFQCNFSTAAATQRVQLSTDFTIRPMVKAIIVYMYNTNAVSTWNDSDAIKVDSGVNQLGFELKFKSKTILKYDAANQANNRRRYLFETYKRRHGFTYPVALCQESDDTTKVWIPPTVIDLASVEKDDPETHVLAGLPSNSDLELIVSNAVPGGNYSANCNLQICLAYVERVQLNPSNGQLTFFQ